MRELFHMLRKQLERGRDAVLVTILASGGSTPRGAGARMLVTRDGRLWGTVGGGAVEQRCQQIARQTLAEQKGRVAHFPVQDLGMICGGDVQIGFRYIACHDVKYIDFIHIVEQRFAQVEPCWLIETFEAGQPADIGLFSPLSGPWGLDVGLEHALTRLDGKAKCLYTNDGRFFCEKLVDSARVYIFGGGHVAQALVPALTAVDFRCTVLEDRDDFCSPQRFGGLAETKLIDNSRMKDFVTVTGQDYVVIMTRGHKDDQTILLQALATPARYIGVIGSRSKAALVRAELAGMGFSQDSLARIVTPIGLDIGAETPAEIAVSITAQLIGVRAAEE